MITLRPMSPESFQNFLVDAVPSYAREKMKAEDLSWEEAEKVAIESFHRLLPQGIETPGSFVYDLVETESGQTVGALWYSSKGETDKAFIYELVLKPEHQGKGYGKVAMKLAEEDAMNRGFVSLGLHVFGWNHRARALYEKTGYEVIGLVMRKKLER